jgi:hypothetical protein
VDCFLVAHQPGAISITSEKPIYRSDLFRMPERRANECSAADLKTSEPVFEKPFAAANCKLLILWVRISRAKTFKKQMFFERSDS